VRGFTLLEVLVALSIIATALVSLLSLHARNIAIAGHDRNLVRATFLAQELMTRTLLEQAFPDPTELRGQFEEDPEYAWELTILRGPTRELEDEIRELRVRVFWDREEPNAAELVTHVRKAEE
jgi:general secretion pathway protein I